MKRILFYFGIFMFAAITITGCDKNEEPATNYLKYAGKTRSIAAAAQIFFGHYYNNNANAVTLAFQTDEHIVLFELFVSNSNTKLVSGTYVPNDNYQPFTISAGAIVDGDGNIVYNMQTANVTIQQDGSTYTINVNGTLEDGTSINGQYTGQLNWVDESEDNPDSNFYTIDDGSSQQDIELGTASQSNIVSGTNNIFMVSFSETFIVTFMINDLSAATLPAGTYPVSTATPVPTGECGVVIKIPGVSGVAPVNSGSFTVQKNGSDYNITFNFTTDTNPERTITGSYSGALL